MSKKSDKRRVKKTEETLRTMRGIVEAARVPITRRLISPAKAMEAVRLTAQKGLEDVRQIRDRKRRGIQAVSEDSVGRKPTNQRTMQRQVLSSQVRKLYHDAKRALVCQSRANRREVLFALQKTGKNGYGNRKAKWTNLSYISCKKRG